MTDIAIHTETPPPADPHQDHFESQAFAIFKTFAAKSRQLQQALDKIDDLQRDLTMERVRVEQLHMSNEQLHQRVGESMARESEAWAEAARLRAVLQISGNALTEAREYQPNVTPIRPRG
jgi:regulator of replication initiation timing